MLRPAPPISSTERVRQFRKRNPGYDLRWKSRRDAKSQARRALLQAQAVAVAAAEKPVLMLPAPVQDPLMAEIDALAASLASRTAREALAAPLIALDEAA